jgi:hypothetical protein
MLATRFGLALLASATIAHADITTPKEFLGFDVCQDYHLANYTQLTQYWQKLAKESNRVRLVNIGKTEGGRDQWMAIISDPLNLKHLEDHRQTSIALAKADGQIRAKDIQARIKRGKAVIWIDGGLHANETLCAQHLIEQAYQLVSRNDDENKRVLKDCIILLAHANPDGMDLVSNWYMRKKKPEDRSLAGIPELYQKYAGHDNNRDFYANNLAETRNINRVLYKEWLPQIVYNHHQSSPAGAVMYIPPFRNPFNYNMDPLVQVSTDLVGLHMHQRLIGKGMGGTVMRTATGYSTWWNGGLRTTTYFHNMIGILTETWGSPNPSSVPFVKNRQIPSTDGPKPLSAEKWTLRQSLDYEVEANYAVLDYASRYRNQLLTNMYNAARSSVDRGQTDTWSAFPSRIEQFGKEALTKPELRDPRYYILPANPRDPGSQKWFLERLQQTGIEVSTLRERAVTAQKTYPAGSFVIRASQAFRPHILDMFEPQDHPNDFQYPGGPPIAPYDSAGYTLAFQMGIEFDRVLDPISAAIDPVETAPIPAGPIFDDIDSYAFMAKPRVALWDRFGGSMESGWTRFSLERFKFAYQVVFGADLDEGKLRDRFDVIIFPAGAIPAAAPNQVRANPLATDPTVPADLIRRLPSLTLDRTVPALKEFVEQGGRVVAIGTSATNLAKHLALPVENGLAGLKDTEFYIPGSVLQVSVDRNAPVTRGLVNQVDVMFDDSPAFKVSAPARVIGSYALDKPLRSGGAWGQEKLKGLAAFVEVPVGKGTVYLYGPEINFRAQPSQTMKLMFNAILGIK